MGTGPRYARAVVPEIPAGVDSPLSDELPLLMKHRLTYLQQYLTRENYFEKKVLT